MGLYRQPQGRTMSDLIWTIEARAFPIWFTPFTHNFWVLTAGGAVADQLHGLAVDPRTGRTKPVGSSRHLLQVVRGADFAWALQPGQPRTVAASGREAEVAPRWRAAVAAMAAINALGLRYPNLWQHASRPNSNAVFNTLGQIMGFAAPGQLMPTLAPGVRLVVSRAVIEQYRFIPLSTG
jgi:hypothetical protein